MKIIAFRADGGQNIGMGHVMRCLSLAKEFRRNRHKVYFLSKLEKGIEKIEEENFEVIQLNDRKMENTNGFNYGNVDELDGEVEEIVKAIKKYKIELFFIDTYNITEEYFLKIKPHVRKLGYIDDLNKFVYPVDILINGNITAEYMEYKKYSEQQIMLLGPKYNLIRDEFRNLPERDIKEEVKEIMITTGGSDPYNMSIKIVNMILQDEELKHLTINIIVGNGFKNKEELKIISNKNENVILYENVKCMSKIMLKSDITISAGGSTLYELCTCGTPVLAFIMADNQEFIVKKMNELGYIKSIGWYKELNSKVLTLAVKSLVKDFDLRKKLSIRGRNLIDAKGVQRIVSFF